MKKFSFFIAIFSFCAQQLMAQQNCSNPIPVTICPSVKFTNQTNAGMLDDATSSCNIPGEDLVYDISAPNGAAQIFITVENASGPMLLYMETGTCGTGACTSSLAGAGNSNLTFTVGNATHYYLWVDAATTVTYDISFGADTGTDYVNIPNTQGNLDFDASGCATPMFKSAKPYFQVSYNGVYKTQPMTLAPLFVNGTLCIITYFKNTTGIEGIKRFDFYFNSLGYSPVSAAPAVIPGFYNAGNWVASNVGSHWTFTFYDALGLGKGDFLLPGSCLRYAFCFNVTPLTNDPVLTNVIDSAFSDGFGAPFSGYVTSGCCPPGNLSCIGIAGGGGIGAGHAFGSGFNDPPGPLPIILLAFDAHAKNQVVDIDWTTQSELNNDYFTVQKSQNGFEWITVTTMKGAGNSTSTLSYHFTDSDPFPATSYYRLKQTDFDGTESYSPVVAVKSKILPALVVYPNPTRGQLILSSKGTPLLSGAKDDAIVITLQNVLGETFHVDYTIINGDAHLDLSGFSKGIYMLEFNQSGMKTSRKIILQD